MKNNLLSLKDYRNNPEFYFSKGLRCANKRNLNDAYKYLLKASKMEPDNTEYSFNMACFLSEMRRPREANRIFADLLLHHDPTITECYFGLACNHFELGDIKKAAEYFERYIVFDSEGEFSEEVSEMIFYLKLYNEVSHDKKFIKVSKNNYSDAVKMFEKGSLENAEAKLYKAIIANSVNVEARNLLTLVHLLKGELNKAIYINRSVRMLEPQNVWASCLKAYIVNAKKRQSSVLDKEFLQLASLQITDRRDVLAVAATLIAFNRRTELVLFLKKQIVFFCDELVYAVLLLAFIAVSSDSYSIEMQNIISIATGNERLKEWSDNLVGKIDCNGGLDIIEEFHNILKLYGEDKALECSPNIHYRLLQVKDNKYKKLQKPYTSIVKSAIEHKEIIYSKHYDKEIERILSRLIDNKNSRNFIDISEVDVCAAVMEYIYCNENYIEMSNQELADKYNITLQSLNRTIKILENHLKL